MKALTSETTLPLEVIDIVGDYLYSSGAAMEQICKDLKVVRDDDVKNSRGDEYGELLTYIPSYLRRYFTDIYDLRAALCCPWSVNYSRQLYILELRDCCRRLGILDCIKDTKVPTNDYEVCRARAIAVAHGLKDPPIL